MKTYALFDRSPAGNPAAKVVQTWSDHTPMKRVRPGTYVMRMRSPTAVFRNTLDFKVSVLDDGYTIVVNTGPAEQEAPNEEE